VASFAFIFGFAMVWHIFWLAALSLIGVIVFVFIRTFDGNTEYVVAAREVEKIERGKHA
jgi:cytochrome o ubiquinol oxidase subunit 1